LYYYRRGISFDLANSQEEITTGYTAVSGYINLVSIRNHVIVARERFKGNYTNPDEELIPVQAKSEIGFFGPIVRKRYSQILGGDQYVYELNMDYYENAAGSTHCVSNVIRSTKKW